MEISNFKKDVLEGLSANPKRLSSKYFYDKKGSHLFQQIMQLEEYYLTNCEFEIFETHREGLLKLFQNANKPFQLIEFGAGDGLKTKLLLETFVNANADFQYLPIDISKDILEELSASLEIQFPTLDVQTIHDDYFKGLESLEKQTNYRKVVLFVGANIGNFDKSSAKQFLSEIKKRLSKDDLLLVGFDLKKDPATILAAYNDRRGVTRDFNLNLLIRLNRELGANFDLSKFIHAPIYNPSNGMTESFLVSTETQDVHFKELEETFHFEAWEAIHTEISKKYGLQEIERLAKSVGFSVVEHFFDNKKYFVDTIWKA